MKKSILAISIASFFIISCNKNKENTTNEEVTSQTQVENQDETATQETPAEEKIPYLYKADNGDIIEVDFLTENEPVQVNIKANGKDFTLNQTEAWAKGAEYGDDNTHFTFNQEKATLKSDGATTELVLISPLTYKYTDGNNSISVTYFSKNNEDDKRYVTLKRDGQEDLTLGQAEAWAKGATYKNDNIEWTDNGDSAILKENGKETTYKQVQ